MEKTRMLVLSVCLASMLLGCAEALHVTNATVNGSDALPTGALPTHVTSSNLTATSNSSTATSPTSRPVTHSPANSLPLASAATSASLLGPCAHLLVTAISALICGALG